MHQQQLLAVLSVGVGGVLAGASGLPRGVAPEDAKLYTPSTDHTFTCLTNPSVVIPFSAVNDDYCDCPDGSDEPGTSACAHIPHKQSANRGFYCANKGHTPHFLPSSRVNDGICDYEICCDGSDEYNHVGGVKCENRCKEIGAKVRELLKGTWKIRNEGGTKRKELELQAAEMRKEIEANVHQLQSVIVGLEEKLKGLEARAKEVEAREIARLVRQTGAGGKKGKANVVAEVAQQRIDELRTALEKLRDEELDAKNRLEEAEEILKGLKETYNPNFNDEGVKSAVRKWEDYVAAGKSFVESGKGRKSDAEQRDLDELINGEEINWEELTGPDAEDEIKLSAFEEYLPPGIREWIHEKLANLRQILVENGILAEKMEQKVPTDSKAVNEAKAAVAATETELTAKRNQLSSHQADLQVDYGPREVFRPLKGTCVSRDIGEYKYEYCFFEKAYQKSLKDSSSTFLGDHKRIEINDQKATTEVQDGIFPAGDIEEQHEEKLTGMVAHHDGGARCWNGPERSARIEFYCSVENEIRTVVEAEKCVYRFEVGTPAVCMGEEDAREETEEKVRDEL